MKRFLLGRVRVGRTEPCVDAIAMVGTWVSATAFC